MLLADLFHAYIYFYVHAIYAYLFCFFFNVAALFYHMQRHTIVDTATCHDFFVSLHSDCCKLPDKYDFPASSNTSVLKMFFDFLNSRKAFWPSERE